MIYMNEARKGCGELRSGCFGGFLKQTDRVCCVCVCGLRVCGWWCVLRVIGPESGQEGESYTSILLLNSKEKYVRV
jgi:hypothetical protein